MRLECEPAMGIMRISNVLKNKCKWSGSMSEVYLQVFRNESLTQSMLGCQLCLPNIIMSWEFCSSLHRGR